MTRMRLQVLLLVTGLVATSLLMIIGSSMINVPEKSEILEVPGTYPDIQSAIDAASPGSIIQIASGEFNENLKVDKAVSLVGSGRGATIIRGKGVPRFTNSYFSTYVTVEVATEDESFIPVTIKDLDIIAFEIPEVSSKDRSITIYQDGAVHLDINNVNMFGKYGMFVSGVGAGSLINLTSSVIESSEVGIRVFGDTNGFDGKSFPVQINVFNSKLLVTGDSGTSYYAHYAVGAHATIIQSTLEGGVLLDVGGDMTIVNSALGEDSGITINGSRVSVFGSIISSTPNTAISLLPYEWGESALDLNSTKITGNSGYGIMIEGSECNSNYDLPALSESNLKRIHITGRGNTIEGNTLGSVCPAGYPLPSGFITH